MFKKLTIVLATVLLTGVGFSLTSNSKVSAQTDCTVQNAGGITASGNTVTGTFTVPAGCAKQTVSIAVYKMHENKQLSSQVLFSSNVANFTPGTHTISTTLPDACFYQADMYKGFAPTSLQDNFDYSKIILAWLYGGTKDCLVSTPPTSTTTPTTPTTPTTTTTTTTAPTTTTAQPAAQPAATKLPNTGPGDVLALAGGSTLVAGVAHNLLARRRLS